MQIITIAGNIGRDAEVRSTQNGDKVAGFSVAVSEGRDKPTTWWDVSLWGRRGEALAPYLTRGARVTVSGAFSTREHDGKTYLQCRANEITLQGGKAGETAAPQSGGGYGGGYGGGRAELDSEIPF